jgi:epoxyqueuosine reductase
VFHNEKPADRPFPGWLDPKSHNCLIGCLPCQLVCPENRPFTDWFEGDESFTEEETALIMEGASIDRFSEATVKKLERLELLEPLATLPRNLGVFFD